MPYYSSLSLRNASHIIEPVIKRSHVSIWKWVQKYSHILDSFDVDKKNFKAIFIDETKLNLKGIKIWLWVAVEPNLKVYLGVHVSWNRSSLDAYRFITKLIKKYGRKTVYTDGGLWYIDACRWAGVDHVVYEQELKNVMERMNEYIKDRTEAFDDLFTSKVKTVRNWFRCFRFFYNYVITRKDGPAPLSDSDLPEYCCQCCCSAKER